MHSESPSGFSGLVPSAFSLDGSGSETQPATNLASFVQSVFLDQTSPLYNVEHDHLNSARIGYLFTDVLAERKGNQILGQAEMPQTTSGSKWAKARAEKQRVEWFGDEVDFLITLYAPYILVSEPIDQLRLLEHELYHCAQQNDQYGVPKFRPDGTPVFTMRGHDVEEFVGIARRYGVGANLRQLFEALLEHPELRSIDIGAVCASCAR